MSANLKKIISVGIIYFFYLYKLFTSKIIELSQSLYHFFFYTFVILYNFGEENFIESTKKIFTYPNNIALIVSDEPENDEVLIESMVNFLKWCLYAKIKNVIVYNPFNVISVDLIKAKLIGKIYERLSKNYTVGISFDEIALNCKNKKEVSRKEMFSYDFDLIISIVNFTNANGELIDKFVIGNNKFPKQLEFYDELLLYKDEYKEVVVQKNYERFYTNKKNIGNPELVICFGKNELCLYGFPFTLLENCELSKPNENLWNLDVILFVKIFSKYSKVQKRFGF